MPSRNSPNPDMVSVTGRNEESVYDCVDKLRAQEEDYINELIDRGTYSLRREEPKIQKPVSQKLEITGAPWQIDSLEQFPTMGASTTSGDQSVMQAAWGTRR